MDELKLEQAVDTKFDENKEVKHVFLLTGEKECELWLSIVY